MIKETETMRKVHAVMLDRAQRQFVAATVNLQAAASAFSLAREAKRRAEAGLVEAIARAQKPRN